MTANVKLPTANTTPMEAGSDAWLKGLTAVSSAIGTGDFQQTLFGFLNQILPVDHCAVFTFDEKAGAGHLFTTSRMGEDAATALAQDYVGGYFARDPNFPRIRDLKNSTDTGAIPVRTSFTEDYDKGYQDRFFDQTDLIDKASTIASAEHGSVYCNFYRMEPSGRYSSEDWHRLERILPLMTSLIANHYRLLKALKRPVGKSDQQSQTDHATPQTLVHSIIGMAIPPFDRLTDRERDVCARILLGFTSEAIALDLGIAASSVATYRKRAYSKLGIVSQNELFGMCLAAVERT